jgi:ABC-type Fe3+ transport system permease subunit
VSVALAVTGLWEPRTFELARNTAGYVGLVAGAATLIGVRVAWAPAFGYARSSTSPRRNRCGPTARGGPAPLQPWTTTPATWITVALFVAGAVLSARFGPGGPSPGAQLWLGSRRTVTSGDEAGTSLTRVLRAGGRLEDASW